MGEYNLNNNKLVDESLFSPTSKSMFSKAEPKKVESSNSKNNKQQGNSFDCDNSNTKNLEKVEYNLNNNKLVDESLFSPTSNSMFSKAEPQKVESSNSKNNKQQGNDFQLQLHEISESQRNTHIESENTVYDNPWYNTKLSEFNNEINHIKNSPKYKALSHKDIYNYA